MMRPNSLQESGGSGFVRVVVMVVGLALAAVLLMPSAASADEGGVPENVADATNPQVGVGNSFSDPYQWWKVPLKKGDTLKATLTVTSDAGDDVYLWLYLPGTTHKSQNTKVASGPTFTYTATQTGDYLFCVYSFDYAGTSYTINWERTAGKPLPFRLSNPVAPARMQAGRVTIVYGFLEPQHPAGTKPVRIYKYQQVAGRWLLRGYHAATVANYQTYSRYSAALHLPSKGAWRIRAFYPRSADYPSKWSPGYVNITVR